MANPELLVCAATLKLDAVAFVLVVIFGIFLFGEAVSNFNLFWISSYLGRLTIPKWLNLPTGVVVLLVVLMALFMFWGSEQLERIFGKKDPAKAPKWRFAATAVLVLTSIGLVAFGQPTAEDRWEMIADENQDLLDDRSVQIHPGELLDLTHNNGLKLVMPDVREERDFNLFHILGARHIPPTGLPEIISELHFEPELRICDLK